MIYDEKNEKIRIKILRKWKILIENDSNIKIDGKNTLHRCSLIKYTFESPYFWPRLGVLHPTQ